MIGKFLKRKQRSDLALEDGAGGNLVTWVTGLTVFFVTLAIAANFNLNAAAHSWVDELDGSISVEIKPPQETAADGKIASAQQKKFDDSVKKILWLADNHPAVAASRALSRNEILDLIEPWLGEKAAADLPLPALIDISLADKADASKLQKDILELVPSATIDTHADMLSGIKTLARTGQIFVLLLTGVIVVLSVMAIAGIVRAKLAIHRQEVETLHLIGASDEYIARQFRQHILDGTFIGAVGGVAATLITLLAAGAATLSVESALLPDLHLSVWQWAVLFFAPVLSGTLIAHQTAQRTVMHELARLP